MSSGDSYTAQTAIRASATAMKAAVKLEDFNKEHSIKNVKDTHTQILHAIVNGADEILLPYILEKNGGNRQQTTTSPGGDGTSNNNGGIDPYTYVIVAINKDDNNNLESHRAMLKALQFDENKYGFWRRMMKKNWDKIRNDPDYQETIEALNITIKKAEKQG